MIRYTKNKIKNNNIEQKQKQHRTIKKNKNKYIYSGGSVNAATHKTISNSYVNKKIVNHCTRINSIKNNRTAKTTNNITQHKIENDQLISDINSQEFMDLFNKINIQCDIKNKRYIVSCKYIQKIVFVNIIISDTYPEHPATSIHINNIYHTLKNIKYPQDYVSPDMQQNKINILDILRYIFLQYNIFNKNLNKYINEIKETTKETLYLNNAEHTKYLVLGANPWEEKKYAKDKSNNKPSNKTIIQQPYRTLYDNKSLYMFDILWDMATANYSDISTKDVNIYDNIMSISRSFFIDKDDIFHNNLLSRFFQIDLNNIIQLDIVSKFLTNKFTAIFFDISVIKFLFGDQIEFIECLKLIKKMLTHDGVLYIHKSDDIEHNYSQKKQTNKLTSAILGAGYILYSEIYFPETLITNKNVARDIEIINKIFPVIGNLTKILNNNHPWRYTRIENYASTVKILVATHA